MPDENDIQTEPEPQVETERRAPEQPPVRAILPIATMVDGRVWAMREELVSALADLRTETFVFNEDVLAARREPKKAQPPAGGVAVVSLHGMVTPKPSLMSMIFGGGDGSLSSFMGNLREAVADPKVNSIVLDIDSPGGMVDGVTEAAAEIRKLRNEKPIVAVANTEANSAAYWLASQAHEVVASPSATLGSIGAYRMHRDISGALANAGIKPTIIRAGKHKVEANPYEPLSDEALAHEQALVDGHYSNFVRDVAAGRNVSTDTVRAGYGEGRVLMAEPAKRAGLADRVATLEETVNRLGSGRARVARTEAGQFTVELEEPQPESVTADSTLIESSVFYTEDEKARILATLVELG